MPRDEVLTYPALPSAVADVLRTLIEAGHEAALVGGSVRDRLRDAPAWDGDWDAATSALPEAVAALFPGRMWANPYGTVSVPGVPMVEVTSYRTEGTYRDRRRPDEVRFGADLAEDLGRRDFTINAMAWVPIDLAAGRGRLVDPFGGREDLAAGILRTVGAPRDRFAEDALRLIRAARFAGEFGFEIEPTTTAAMSELASTASDVSGERVRGELMRILAAAVPSRAMAILERVGLLAVIIPEVAALRGVPQAKIVRGDALDHSLAAVDAAPATGDGRIRLAALLHDIGKATTQADGHFIGHDQVGAQMAGEVLDRLRLPSAMVGEIVHAIRNHMFDYGASWTDAAVRRFIRRLEPAGTDLLFALRTADDAASGVGAAGAAIQAELESRVAVEIERQPDLLLGRRLAIDGDDIQRELGIGAGPRIGVILDRLTELMLDDPSRNEPSALRALAHEVDPGPG